MAKPDTETAGEDQDLEVVLEDREAWRRRLTVTVSSDRVSKERGRQRRQLASTLNLPGFRKGKVPDRVVEERFGPVVDRRTVGALVEAAYQEAVEREALQPIGEPEFGDVQYAGAGKPLTFQVELEVMPALRLERTGGFRVKRPEVTVAESEVEEVLERLRKEQSLWEPVERAPADGDRVSVRIARLGEGAEAEEPEKPGSAEPAAEPEGAQPAASPEGAQPATPPEDASEANAQAEPDEPEARPYRFELGEGYAIPDVEEAIRTLAPGSSGTFGVAFPDDFDDQELAGASRTLRIDLLEVKQRRLPELDDEFASEVGDFEGVEALRDAIREDLRRHKEEEAARGVHDQLLDSIIEANPFKVPRTLIERYLDQVIEAPEDVDPEELQDARRSLEPAAERQIKRQMVLERLIEREGLETTDEELEARLREVAERQGMSTAELRGRLTRDERLDDLRRQIAVQKAFAWLEEQSTVES